VTHVSLFSGIGGDSLAAQWAGFNTIHMVEKSVFRRSVLRKNFPNTPIHDDVFTWNATQFRDRVSLITGGSPCQDLSQAGRREGIHGQESRLIWRFVEIVEQVRPAWVVFENSPNINNLGVDELLLRLESSGYATRSYEVPAFAVGASFLGQRWFLVAKALQAGLQRSAEVGELQEVGHTRSEPAREPSLEIAEPTLQGGRERKSRGGAGQESPYGFVPFSRKHWSEWDHQPLLVRGVDGIPAGVDRRVWEERVMALGDAIVPQQIYPILQAVADHIQGETA